MTSYQNYIQQIHILQGLRSNFEIGGGEEGMTEYWGGGGGAKRPKEDRALKAREH